MKQSDLSTENAEQSQETTEVAHPARRSDVETVHQAAIPLMRELEKIPDGDLISEVIAVALKLLRDDANRGDLKLVAKSIKELRYALKVFSPYRDVRKVSIFGSARTPLEHPDYVAALQFGKKMAEAGWMVITGAGGGIMAAGHGGAGADPSFGLAIRLPFEQKTNEFIAGDKKLINFKYFFTRKLMFVRSSHGIALFPGGFGTMDEGFEVLTLVQTGKSVPTPMVFVDQKGGDFWRGWDEYVQKHLLARRLISPEDLRLYKITDDVDEAVAEMLAFFRNYHSIRFTRDDVIFRLQQAPTPEQLDHINATWSDILINGTFRVSRALPIERDEPALAELPRLVFNFNRRDQGKLRALIDYLNSLVPPAGQPAPTVTPASGRD
jgi:uncharacterized protein (TIGR00730 family)